MNLPIIVTNFKTYESASGEKALILAKIHEKVAKETGASIAIACQAVDLQMIASQVSIPVFAEHFDNAGFGSFTGKITPEAIKASGAFGSLLNHSENRLRLDVLEESIAFGKKLGLYIIACANSPESGKAVSAFNPDLIAIEPPELIGGDISVSNANPEIISDAVKLIGEGKVLVGAGIKTGEDVRKAMELGAVGVLLASGITKAKDPEAVLRDLVKGFIL